MITIFEDFINEGLFSNEDDVYALKIYNHIKKDIENHNFLTNLLINTQQHAEYKVIIKDDSSDIGLMDEKIFLVTIFKKDKPWEQHIIKISKDGKDIILNISYSLQLKFQNLIKSIDKENKKMKIDKQKKEKEDFLSEL